MSLWRKMTTPYKPGEALVCALVTGLFLIMTQPMWSGGEIWVLGLAGGVCALLASLVVKLWPFGQKGQNND